jgi:hypothetical protein
MQLTTKIQETNSLIFLECRWFIIPPSLRLDGVPLFDISGFTITLAWVLFAITMIWYFTLDIQLATIMTIISLPIVYATDIAAKLPFTESLFDLCWN